MVAFCSIVGFSLYRYVNFITLDDLAIIGAASVKEEQGGNVIIDSKNLKLFNQSQITASARKKDDGGNVTINFNTLLEIQSSVIIADAVDRIGCLLLDDCGIDN